MAGTNILIDVIRGVMLNGSDVIRGILYLTTRGQLLKSKGRLHNVYIVKCFMLVVRWWSKTCESNTILDGLTLMYSGCLSFKEHVQPILQQVGEGPYEHFPRKGLDTSSTVGGTQNKKEFN